MTTRTILWPSIIGLVLGFAPARAAEPDPGPIAILSAKWDKEPRKATAFVIRRAERAVILVTRAAILNAGRNVGGTSPELSVYFHPRSAQEVACQARVDSYFHELDLGVARIDDHVEQPLAEISIPEPLDISRHAPPRAGEVLTLHAFHEKAGKFHFDRTQLTPREPLLDLHGEPAVWPIDDALSDLALGAPVFHADGAFAGVVTRLADKIVIVPATRIIEMADSGLTRTVAHRATSSRFLKGRLKVAWEESKMDPFSRQEKANYTYLAADKLPENARLADGSWDLAAVDGAFSGDLHRHDFKAAESGEMVLWAQRVEKLRGHRTRKLPPLRAVFQLSGEPMQGTVSAPGVPVSATPGHTAVLAGRGKISPSESYPAPAKIISATLGGSSRYLIALLEGKRLAVFDVAQAKWSADVPLSLGGETFFIAANHRYAFVASEAGEVIRLSLPSLRAEGDALLTDSEKITAIAVGGASVYSPLLVQATERSVSIDPNQWIMREPQTSRGPMSLGRSGHLTASPDGHAFCTIYSHDRTSLLRWQGGDRFTLEGAKAYPAPCWLDPAGRYLYSRGVTTPPVASRDEVFDVLANQEQESLWRPGEVGAFFLSLPFRKVGTSYGERTPLVTVHNARDQSEVVTLGWFQELTLNRDQTLHRNSERVWLATRQKKIITLPFDNKRVCLRPFDPVEVVARRGEPVVASVAGENFIVAAGTQWTLAPLVFSSSANSELRLLSGPEGMVLAGEKLTWDVPAGHRESRVTAMLTCEGKEFPNRPIPITFEIVERAAEN